MWSAETLATLNNEAELRAYVKKHPLYTLSISPDTRKFPDYAQVDIDLLCRVENLELIETYFVDSSGFGGDGRALDYPVFKNKMTDLIKDAQEKGQDLVSCLTGIGQFQAYVSIFRRVA